MTFGANSLFWSRCFSPESIHRLMLILPDRSRAAASVSDAAENHIDVSIDDFPVDSPRALI